MLIATRPRRGLARLGTALAVASALAMAFSGIGVEVETDTEDTIDGSDLDDLLLS